MPDLHCSHGPVPSMPGSSHSFPLGQMCDLHGEVPAVARIQGETDSFGCEYHLMCAACLQEYRAQVAADRSGVCDWCRQPALDLRKRRDYDEGMCGPLYDVCGACVARENERARDELDAMGGW